jgi:CSLREA domain-containing protein
VRVAGSFLAVLVLSLATASGAQAIAYHLQVTTTADGTTGNCIANSASSTCTLRDAVAGANAAGSGNGFVDVPAGTYTVGSPLSVTKGITITGDGARTTRISGGNTTQVFTIANTSTTIPAKLQALTIADGETTNAGGGLAISGSGPVEITDSAIVDNHVTNNVGAGIVVGQDGDVTINRSLIARNSTSLNGGGLFLRHNDAGTTGTTTLIINTTIAQNTANDGSGIYAQRGVTDHPNVADLRGVTVARNTSTNGAMLTGDPASGTNAGGVYTKLTLVADPLQGATCAPGVDLVDTGDSVETSTACGFPTAHTSQGVALGPLEDNGGPTDTMALGNGSQALDVGTLFTENDQRGNGRTNSALFGDPDAGAYEAVKGTDLGIAAGPFTDPVTAGDTVTYNLTVSSAAAQGIDAAEPRVHIGVPAGAQLVSAVPSQGSCSGADCTLGHLDNGASATVAVTLRPGAAGTVVTAATVSSPRLDSVPADDSVSLTSHVNPAPVGPSVTADTAAPVFAALRLSPATFAAEGSGASIAAKKNRGTKVSYTLSEAGTVTFRVTTRKPGRRVGKHCKAPTKKNKGKRACKRTVTLKGSFTRASKLGANSFHCTGRLRGRKLKPGRYRLVGTAKDAAGNKSKAVSVGFRIIR